MLKLKLDAAATPFKEVALHGRVIGTLKIPFKENSAPWSNKTRKPTQDSSHTFYFHPPFKEIEAPWSNKTRIKLHNIQTNSTNSTNDGGTF
jgi:hypothetical protein